jgi:hypothetical protein
MRMARQGKEERERERKDPRRREILWGRANQKDGESEKEAGKRKGMGWKWVLLGWVGLGSVYDL